MILKPKYMTRFRQVATVLIRNGFSDVLMQLDLNRFLPGREWVRLTARQKQSHSAKRLRMALQELGPAYVKLGQILSTRPDILPAPFIQELEFLQDDVAPFPFAAVKKTVESELERRLDEVFEEFGEVPIAAASLSQVHRAVLRRSQDGDDSPTVVAVKVLRPGVERAVEIDLALLAEVADLIAQSKLGLRYDIAGMVEQLQRTLEDELCLTTELRHLEHFHEALREFKRLRTPSVFPELTTGRLLVMEYMRGSRIADLDPDRHDPELADELWRSYLKQILIDGIFHCDPHPGNFLVDDEGRMVILDFGMVAHLSRETQLQLLALLVHLAERDGDGVADACVELGIPGPAFRERQFKRDIALLVARNSGIELKRIALGQLLVELVRTGFRNDIQVPPEFILLGKTLLNLEGICRRLDPHMDPADAMRKTAGRLLASKLSDELSEHRALAATLEARALLTDVPVSVRRILRNAASNDFRLGVKLEGADHLNDAIQKIASRITLGIITAALIIGSALLLNVQAGPILWGYPIFALIGFLLAAGLGIYLVFRIILMDRAS